MTGYHVPTEYAALCWHFGVLFLGVLKMSTQMMQDAIQVVSGLVGSETELGQLSIESSTALVFGGFGAGFDLLGFESVEGSGLGLSFLLKAADDICLGPSSEGRKIA